MAPSAGSAAISAAATRASSSAARAGVRDRQDAQRGRNAGRRVPPRAPRAQVFFLMSMPGGMLFVFSRTLGVRPAASSLM